MIQGAMNCLAAVAAPGVLRPAAAVCVLLLLANAAPAVSQESEPPPSAASDAAAPALSVIEITPGKEELFHVAVQTFGDEALPSDPLRVGRLLAAVEAGLDFNGVLQPLSRDAFLGPRVTENLASGRYDCSQWSQSGADALVEGVIRGTGGMLEVDYRVWDTARCMKLRRGTIVRPASEIRRLGAALSDQIVHAFTGTRGAADSEIAFISNRSGNREVYVMDADGGRTRTATRSPALKAFPNWMPDGQGILYSTYLQDDIQDLYLSSRGSAPAGRILRHVLPGLSKFRGVFSPDGNELALVVSLDGAADIFRVNRSGGDLRRLTRNSQVIDIAPSWSPDGTRLAFVSDRSGAPQVYVMDRDGKGARRITWQSSYSATPAWSPDGRWIAYGVRAEGQFDLYLTDPEGEVTVPLVVHRRNDQYPTWSPDGRKIVFSSDRRGRYDLYSVDVTSGRLRRLTRDAKDNLAPAWGPWPSVRGGTQPPASAGGAGAEAGSSGTPGAAEDAM